MAQDHTKLFPLIVEQVLGLLWHNVGQGKWYSRCRDVGARSCTPETLADKEYFSADPGYPHLQL